MRTIAFSAALLFAAGVISAENLFQGDSGAEAGIDFVTQGGMFQTRLPVFHDRKIFHEGNGSLRVEWANEKIPGMRDANPEKYFGIDMPELERDQEYTVSFYAKATADDFPIGVHIFTKEGWRRDSSHYLNAKLTTEWKRYSFTFKAKVPRSFFTTAHSLNIMMVRGGKNSKAGTVWFDAFQLEKGKDATPYQASSAAAELHLKSSAPMNIIGKNDKIEANVNALTLRDSGKLALEVTVADWEGKIRKQFKEEFGNSFAKTYELPSDRYGWFNVRLQLKSGDKILSDLTKNYLVVRPPVKIAKGMRPFCGGIAKVEWDSSAIAANRAVGVARFQVEMQKLWSRWNWEPRKGEFDFARTDWLIDEARKNDMAVKFCITPFDWKDWHFPPEEIKEMKKCGGDHHTMLDLRHRKLWNDYVKAILDRYGDKIDTLEFGWEDNGRLGINPYFKKKYPEGVLKDRNGTPWVAAGPAFDALCTLITDGCRMARERFPNMKVGAIRPSQGLPGNPWLFVWKMFEKIGKEFNSFPVDTYSMIPYTIAPGFSRSTRYAHGGADSRFFTMDHAKQMIKKYGCDQDVYVSETGTELFAIHIDYSPYRLEEAEYQVQDLLAARAAGFTAHDSYRAIDDSPRGDGREWSMVLKNGPQMRAGAYSAVAQILENVTESRWIKPDSVTRIALFKKIDGSGRGAVYAQKGYSMYVPEGIQVFDFMGNEYELNKERILPLSGAAWYFSAPKYQTLVEKLSNPQIDQTDYCKLAFRYISDKTGLLRLTNNSNQHSVVFECIVSNGSKEIQKNIPVMAGSWNSFRIPLDGASDKLIVKYRRQGLDKKYTSEEIKLSVLTPIQSGNTPVSDLGRVDGRGQILPNEPWTPWSGVKDLGMVLYGSWTDAELKLKAVVTDDLHHPSKNPNSPWNADSIQFAIDPKNDGTFFKADNRNIGPDDLEFGVRIGKDGKVSKTIAKGNKNIRMDIQASRDDESGTTVYEISIPWSELGIKPQKNMVFGLSAVIFDDDTGHGQEYYGMIGGGIAGGKNPALYKRFVLKDKENGNSSASSVKTENILKNPEFADQGKSWKLRYSKIEESIQEEDGRKVVKMEMHTLANKKGNNVFSQTVRNPEGGDYVYSVELSPSGKFKIVQVIVMYRDDNGKVVYQFSRMNPADYPEPGKWKRIIGEAKIPEGRKYVSFAVEFHDPKPEGFLLIRSPEMNLREE